MWASKRYVTIIPGVPPMEVGPLFEELEKTQEKVIIVQGGGDAAKTSTIEAWLAVKAIQNPGCKVNIVGLTSAHLKEGAMQVFKDYIEPNPQIKPFITNWHESDKFYRINKSKYVFRHYDKAKKARGSENDYVLMNEGNLQPYELFWELYRKTRKKILIDYNPTTMFWVHSKLLDKSSPHYEKQFEGKVKFFRVWHAHNPFLTEEQHQDYENISDPERFRVYARGLSGVAKGKIFTMKKVDAIPEGLKFGFGIDFGYNNDKTSIVKVYIDGKKRYYHELYYKVGVDTDEIARVLIENGCLADTMVWGDHDKNASTYLRRLNIPFRLARKGPNSLSASISKTKEFENYYYNSPNLEKELETYIWDTGVDLVTGNEVFLNVPVEGKDDHSIAAIRYFNFSYSLRHIA